MNLFNKKTITRHQKPGTVPADHQEALTAWSDTIRDGRIYSLKETALHDQFTAKIVKGVLGYHGPAGGADYTVATEQTILRGSVDLALGRFGGPKPEILAPFELKGADGFERLAQWLLREAGFTTVEVRGKSWSRGR